MSSRARQKAIREARIAAGLCAKCGAPRIDRPGRAECKRCADRDSKRERDGFPYDDGPSVWDQLTGCVGLDAALAEAERDLAEAV